MGEAAGHDDRVDALRASRRRARGSRAVAAELLDRPDDVELAVRAGEQHDADAFAHQLAGQLRDRDLVRLDHRVREQPLAHLFDLRARRAASARVDDEADRLADVHLRHVRVTERRQRPLDRRAGRIGDAGQVGDLDVRFVSGHAADVVSIRNRVPLAVREVRAHEREIVVAGIGSFGEAFDRIRAPRSSTPASRRASPRPAATRAPR